MKTVKKIDRMSTKDARSNLADVLDRVGYDKERIYITRRGRNIAVICPPSELERLDLLEDKVDVLLAERSKKESEGKLNIGFDELCHELVL